MRGRLAQNDVSNYVNVEDPGHVGASVVGLLSARYPGADMAALAHAYADTRALFSGAYPGYLPCDTLYHDLRHTLDVSLAMARLVDGHDRIHPEAERLGPRRAMLGIIIALLHARGPERASEREVGNGAVFTKVHASRSADFLARYRRSDSPPRPALPRGSFTSPARVRDRRNRRRGPEGPPVGLRIGTADLIAQIRPRVSRNAALPLRRVRLGRDRARLAARRARGRAYRSAEDLIRKTPDYYQHVAQSVDEAWLGRPLRGGAFRGDRVPERDRPHDGVPAPCWTTTT
jgi:hypothetical protein